MGIAQSGTANTLQTFSRKTDVTTTFGQGPLSEAACKVLDLAGGPVHCLRLTGSVAGANGAVTKTAIGASTGTITLAGAPFDDYEGRVEIMVTGTLGTARFRYSLDDERTFSEEIVVPAAGTYLIPSTNVTVTFVAGAGPVFFEDGDIHEWVSTAPYYSTADVATAVTALLAQTVEFPFIILTGQPSTAANAATMFAALGTHATTFQTANRFIAWIMSFGNDTTGNTQTQLAGVTSSRIMPVYGRCDVSSSKTFAGYGSPSRPAVEIVGARAAQSLISTDLARVASGPLDGVVGISHDEALTELIDAHRCTTLRSLTGRSGFFVTNGRIKSAAGSDFRYWQHRRVMDVICRRAFVEQQQFLSMGVRTTSTGTIDERDATRLEAIVNSALRAELTQPANAEGTRGHVSAIAYAIDRQQNLITTETLLSTIPSRPLGYAKNVTTTIGYSLTVGG